MMSGLDDDDGFTSYLSELLDNGHIDGDAAGSPVK
jgi:hypothetical protein